MQAHTYVQTLRRRDVCLGFWSKQSCLTALIYLKVSEAFELDDSGLADRSSGRPFTLNDGEDVEFLGTPEDYFIPKAPLWNLLPELVRIAPKNCGMLPLVRAAEQLKLLPAEDRAAQTTAILGASLADYRRRRG